MTLQNNSAARTGDCECCTSSIGVTLTLRHNDWMCENCMAQEDAVVPTVVQTAHDTDMQVNSKTDILVAQTVSMAEIKAAIWADTNIPEAKKQYVYASAVSERHTHFQKMLFEQRQAISETEKIVKEWQKNVQQEVGRLQADERAKFTGMDVTYQPVKPKTVKAAKTGAPKKSTKQVMEEVYAAAKKYDVPAAAVQMMATARNMSPEDAAKDMAAKRAALRSQAQ